MSDKCHARNVDFLGFFKNELTFIRLNVRVLDKERTGVESKTDTLNIKNYI
jgi:hypothetical protein